MEKTVTESVFKCHDEKFDFSSTELLFAMLDAYNLFRKTFCYSLAHVLRNLHSKAGLVLKNTLSYAVVILGTRPQR